MIKEIQYTFYSRFAKQLWLQFAMESFFFFFSNNLPLKREKKKDSQKLITITTKYEFSFINFIPNPQYKSGINARFLLFVCSNFALVGRNRNIKYNENKFPQLWKLSRLCQTALLLNLGGGRGGGGLLGGSTINSSIPARKSLCVSYQWWNL